MDWKANKEKLLNPLGQVYRLYEHAELITQAKRESIRAMTEFFMDGQWNECPRHSYMKCDVAYRVNPQWLDAKIAEQEAAEARAKEQAWVDLPTRIDPNGECCIMIRHYCQSVIKVQTHPRFAGIVAQDGYVYKSWHSYVDRNQIADADGYRIPQPKAVRMWKEVIK